MEFCRSFAGKGGRGFLAFGMERLRSWVARKFSGSSCLARCVLFAARHWAQFFRRAADIPAGSATQCRGGSCLKQINAGCATALRCGARRHVIHLVSPERLGRCLRTDVCPIDRSPAEANIISTATGKRRAFAFDMREMLRRANAAYDLRAAEYQKRAPAPNTCKPARLARAIRRGFGRRNRSQ